MPVERVTLNKTFIGYPNGSTENASALAAQLLAAIEPNSGVAELNFLPGIYKLNWDVDIATLYAAGCRKIVLDGNNVATLIHSNTDACIDFDNSARVSTQQSVTAYSLQTYQGYDYIHRLSVTNA